MYSVTRHSGLTYIFSKIILFTRKLLIIQIRIFAKLFVYITRIFSSIYFFSQACTRKNLLKLKIQVIIEDECISKPLRAFYYEKNHN